MIGARIASMVAGLVGAAGGLRGWPGMSAPRLRHRRSKASSGGGMTLQRIAADCRKRSLERFGLDVLGPDKRPDPATVRAMRRARKAERQIVRPKPTRKPADLSPKRPPFPCARFNRLRTHGERVQHIRGARGCDRCAEFIKAEARRRGLKKGSSR